DLLLGLRRRDAKEGDSAMRRAGFASWAQVWSTRAGFEATKVATPAALGALGEREDGPGWLGGWARGRMLPIVSSPSMRKQLRDDHD
ncbi:MAG: hypothetical protein ACI867_002002, partial [Glaciecola sp.]